MVEQAHSASWNDEAQQFGMRALWRLAIWGGLAAFALFAAVISAYSNAGSQRLAASIAAGPGAAGLGTAQPRTSADEIAARPGEEETRRLTQTVRSLAADRDQLLTRVALLERNLDGVTGSIKRDRIANPQQAPQQAAPQAAQQIPQPQQVPQQAQNPAAATAAAPAARPEMPAAPVTEAVVAPAQTPAPGASNATPVAAPDAGNRVAVNVMRVGAPAEPLAAAGGLGVDVGGAANYDGLRTLWHSTKNSDPALLEDLYPVVTVRENGKTRGADLRLIVGPIADAEAAARLCTTLSAAHHYCQPVAFEGQRLSLIDTTPTKTPPPPFPAPAHHAAPSPQTPAPQAVYTSPVSPHVRALNWK